MWCEDWGRVGKGSTIYVYNWLLFQYLLLDSTFIFFFFKILNLLTFLLRLYVFIKAMFSFIFTSLTAVHMYDFNII